MGRKRRGAEPTVAARNHLQGAPTDAPGRAEYGNSFLDAWIGAVRPGHRPCRAVRAPDGRAAVTLSRLNRAICHLVPCWGKGTPETTLAKTRLLEHTDTPATNLAPAAIPRPAFPRQSTAYRILIVLHGPPKLRDCRRKAHSIRGSPQGNPASGRKTTNSGQLPPRTMWPASENTLPFTSSENIMEVYPEPSLRRRPMQAF